MSAMTMSIPTQSQAQSTATPAYVGIFQTPTLRGQTNTQVGIWDRFTSASSANSPDVTGATSKATLRQTDTTVGGVILTSSGNIYGPSVIPKFVIADTNIFTLTNLVLQTRVLGAADIDHDKVVLKYGAKSVKPTRTALTDVASTGSSFGGAGFSSRYDFNLSGLGITTYTIEFQPKDANVSLDAVALDVAGVTADTNTSVPTLTLDNAAPAPVKSPSITLTGKATDLVTVANVFWRKAGTKKFRPAFYDATTQTWSAIVKGLSKGVNRIQIKAVSVSNKESAIQTVIVRRK